MSAPPCWCSRPAASRGLAVVLLSFVFSCVSVMPMETTVSAASPAVVTRGVTYDASALARVGVPATETRLASSRQVAGLREGAASPSFEAHVAPTTSPRSFVAANLADDGAQLALGSGRFTNANFASGQLEAHFAKHADEWGAIGQDAYLARARSMLSSDPGGNLAGFVRSNGDVLRYNVRTNEFAVGSSSGVIRTLFRPDDGMDYWLKQVAAG